LAALVPVPAGVVTLIFPVVAPAGTVVVILLAELIANGVAGTPLNVTDVAPVKLAPLIVTVVPTAPLVGVKLVIRGATVKLVALVAVPPAVVTVIPPVVALADTVAVICVLELTEKAAEAPLNLTELAPVKAVPVIVTLTPTFPLAGVKPVMLGLTVKFPVLVTVPTGVVTLILPVVAPAGTVAVILIEELGAKPAETPLNFTDETPVKLAPLMVTLVPITPLVGVKLVIRAATVKSVALVAVPAGFVTVIFPVVALPGTVAVILMSELRVKAAASPLNLTDVVPLKFVPLIVTLAPTAPLGGANPEIPGAE
jgi:hypothetical protein